MPTAHYPAPAQPGSEQQQRASPSRSGADAEVAAHQPYGQDPGTTPSQQDGSQQQGDDFLSHQMHQLLISDMATFWTSTVAPGTQDIAQCSLLLQKEAADLGSRAEAELAGVMAELTRVHSLVAHFQDQIRETLSLLQG